MSAVRAEGSIKPFRDFVILSLGEAKQDFLQTNEPLSLTRRLDGCCRNTRTPLTSQDSEPGGPAALEILGAEGGIRSGRFWEALGFRRVPQRLYASPRWTSGGVRFRSATTPGRCSRLSIRIASAPTNSARPSKTASAKAMPRRVVVGFGSSCITTP